MEMIPLSASARDRKAKPSALRKSGKVPCVVYGNEIESMPIEVSLKDLHKTFVKAGESVLVELTVDGKKIPVLFKDITFHPVTGNETHADFYAVNMKEEIETQVPIHFNGESPAVKELNGVLVTSHNELTVRCLPTDLPHDLPVDISSLAAIGDVLTVAQMSLPKGVKIMEEAETVIASIQEQRAAEEETVAAPAEGEAAAAEGATPAEGAAPAEGEGEKKE